MFFVVLMVRPRAYRASCRIHIRTNIIFTIQTWISSAPSATKPAENLSPLQAKSLRQAVKQHRFPCRLRHILRASRCCYFSWMFFCDESDCLVAVPFEKEFGRGATVLGKRTPLLS